MVVYTSYVYGPPTMKLWPLFYFFQNQIPKAKESVMAKSRRHSLHWMKDYFKSLFPKVQDVKVESFNSGPREVLVKAKVKIGNKWLVMSKKGESVSKVLSNIKEGMREMVRKNASRKQKMLSRVRHGISGI